MIHIKVQMEGKTPRYELWDGDTFIRVVSKADIVEMVRQFASALRF